MTALSIKDLYKSYGQNEVLKGVSFEVKRGEIFAVLGINGAGKTTLLEIIEGLRKFDRGGIQIMGKPQTDALSKIGVQLQSSTLPNQIKIFEVLTLFSLWNWRNDENSLIARFGLAEIKNKKYSELSTGQKRRLHLALSLVSNPDVLFLDEPTAGLDVEGRASLHAEIRALKLSGKTIIIASHDMAEVETLCDRLIMLSGGKVVFCGTVNDFTVINKSKFKIHIKLHGQNEYSVFEIDDLNAALSDLLERQRAGGNSIDDIKIKRPTLEDSFLAKAKEVRA